MFAVVIQPNVTDMGRVHSMFNTMEEAEEEISRIVADSPGGRNGERTLHVIEQPATTHTGCNIFMG